MAANLLLGIDIGTYSSKGVLCTPDGTVLAEHQVEHGLSLPQPGWAEQDADAIWWADFVKLCQVLPQLAGQPAGEIGAVAVSGLGPDLLPLDAQGKPLRPAILYGIDGRATAEIAVQTGRFGADAVLDRCGTALTTQAVGPKGAPTWGDADGGSRDSSA